MNVSGLMKFLVEQNHMSTTQAANSIMACMEEIHLFAAEPAASAFGSQEEIIMYFLNIDPELFYNLVGD